MTVLIALDEASSDYLRRHRRAKREVEEVYAGYREQVLSIIKWRLKSLGLSVGHLDDVWSNFLERLFDLRLKSAKKLRKEKVTAYLRAVARNVTFEYASKLYNSKLQGFADIDEHVYSSEFCAEIIELREKFTRKYERIRDTDLKLHEKFVVRAYTWHTIHNFDDRIKINASLAIVNAQLTRIGHSTLTKDQFKKAWGHAQDIMRPQLEELANQLREAISRSPTKGRLLS